MPRRIPQNQLRNQSGEILRRAELGERFIVTVNGRPTAELGPVGPDQTPARPGTFARLVRQTPVRREFAEDILRIREDDEGVTVDPMVA